MSPTSLGSPLAATVHNAAGNGAGPVSVITIDASEPVPAGHFPGFPIVPGVCLIECVQQSFLLALADLEPRPVLTRLERCGSCGRCSPGKR